MIYIECKPDRLLVTSLVRVSARQVIHAHNKPTLCKILTRKTRCDGLVDEDQNSVQPPYHGRVRPGSNYSEYDFKVFHDDANDNRLIVLCPKLEDWVVKTARLAGVDPGSYGLPKDPDRLHREVNLALDRFDKLLQAISGNPRMQALKRALARRAR